MPQSLTIADGIEIFAKEFDFNGKANTKKTYLRALVLFGEFISSADPDKSPAYRDLNLNSPISELPNTITTGFTSWLREHSFPIEYRGRRRLVPNPTLPHPTKTYSANSVYLYETALQRVLRFWRSRDLLSFNELNQAEAERASTTKSKSRNHLQMDLRASLVPDDFGEVMFSVANQLVSDLGNSDTASRSAKLETLRAKSLIHVLMTTGLRVSDVVTLTKNDIELAKASNGNMQVTTKKSGSTAFCYLDDSVFSSIEAYLLERKDKSPWLFIQHGRTGKRRDGIPGNYSRLTTDGKLRRGYGAPITPQMVWRIVNAVSRAAGYDHTKNDQFVSPHALRHWLAQSLRNAQVPLNDIQAVLGHTSVETTRKIYAPSPNLKPVVAAIKQMNADRTKK
jgi:integrase